MEKAEQIDDFVTFMKPDTKLEEIKNEIVQTENLLRPFYSRSKNHTQREIYYESIWKRLNESTKEIEQIVERKNGSKKKRFKEFTSLSMRKKKPLRKSMTKAKRLRNTKTPSSTRTLLSRLKMKSALR